jgi:hypothetical protein
MKYVLTLLLVVATLGCTEKKEHKRTLVVIQGDDTTRTPLPDRNYSIYLPKGQYDWSKKDTIRIVYTQFNDAIRICYADTFIRASKVIPKDSLGGIYAPNNTGNVIGTQNNNTGSGSQTINNR